jgi:hypothetical protein
MPKALVSAKKSPALMFPEETAKMGTGKMVHFSETVTWSITPSSVSTSSILFGSRVPMSLTAASTSFKSSVELSLPRNFSKGYWAMWGFVRVSPDISIDVIRRLPSCEKSGRIKKAEKSMTNKFLIKTLHVLVFYYTKTWFYKL